MNLGQKSHPQEQTSACCGMMGSFLCCPVPTFVARPHSIACFRAAGPPHKLSERVTRQTPLSRAGIATVLGALRLADLQGFDPQPENAVAAGSFCFAPPGGLPQQVSACSACG